MGLELLGTGAGAGQGLEQLIAQRRADELMRQQALVHAMSAIGLRENRQDRLAQQKSHDADLTEARNQTNKSRQQMVNLQQLQALPMGTDVGPSSFARLTNPETGATPPESFDMSPGTSASLPSVSLAGMSAIGPRGPEGMAPQTQETSRAIDPSYRFKGTAQQQDREAGLNLRESAMKALQGNQEWRNSIQQQLADQKAANQGPKDHFSFLPTYDDTGKPTGVAAGNTSTGRLAQVQGGPIVRAAPGAAAANATADKKKTGIQAVTRLDSDIDQADQMGLIGPASGRLYQAFAKVGTTGDPKLDDMIGRLKGDILLAKMHVDAGIGGMRAASSPLLLKNWEDIAMSSSKALLKGYTGAMRADMGGDTAGAKPKFEIISVK